MAKKIAVPVIQVTNDFNMFKHLDINRSVKKNKALHDSIAQSGLLPFYPIVVTPSFAVIDGQHRLAEAMAIMEERKAADPNAEPMNIYYIVDNSIADETTNDAIVSAVLEPNRTSNKWDTNDYLNLYSRQGVDIYKVFDEVTKELPFSGIGNRIVLFSHGKTTANKFKNGKLVGDAEFYKEVVNFLLEASCPLNGRTPFLQAIVMFFDLFKPSLDKTAWKKFSEQLVSEEVEQTSREAYIKRFLKLAGYVDSKKRNKFYDEIIAASKTAN